MGFGADTLEVPLGLSKDPSVDRLLSQIPKDAKSKLGAGFEKTFRGIETVGRDAFSRLGRMATSFFALAGAGGVGFELNFIAKLDHSTKILGRTAELTASQEEMLRSTIEDVAVSVGTARDEQIAGLQLMQDRYAVVNKLAEEGTLGTQIELAAKLQNAYNLEVTDTYNLLGGLTKMAGLSGDKLIENLAMLEQASFMGSMGVKELGMVMTELLATAGSMGQGGEDAVKDIAAITEATTAAVQDTQRARTYVRSFIQELGSADVGEKLFSELGVRTKDSEDEFLRLSDIVTDMIGQLDKLSTGKQKEVISDIFGSKEIEQVIAALLGGGRGAYEGILKLEVESEGFLEFLDEQADSSATELQKLKESVRAVLDEAITPLLGYLTEHADSLKNIVKWIGKNPLKTGFALLFGPSLIKIVGSGIVSAISKGFAAKTVTEGISGGLKGAGTMTVYATNVNVVGGKGGIPGGGKIPVAGPAAAGGLGLLGKFMNWKSIALAGQLGLPASAMLKMLGPAALAPGLGLAGMIGGGAAIGAGTLGFVGAGLSDYQKRTSGQAKKDVWTRADELSSSGKEQFREEYYKLEEDKRTTATLNRILDAILAQETTVKTTVNITPTGPGETPAYDYEAH